MSFASISIGPERLDAPVALAPMAGITDAPFRKLAARFGAPYVVSEMVASREVVLAQRALSATRTRVGSDTALAAVQIAGCEARWMGEAARMVVDAGARVIDINMGCPAKKVTNGYAGSALMRVPDHALRLIEATVVAAAPVPVTLKLRLGWDESCLNAPEIARLAVAAGVRMISVHGRTRAQFYKGSADWRAVRRVVKAVGVPVLVNGDIRSADEARLALAASGAAGVMIGRAAQGQPWVVGQIAHALAPGGSRPIESAPSGAALAELIVEQYEGNLETYGAEVGVRCMRKHLSWYLQGRPGGEAVRAQVIRNEDVPAILRTVRAYDWPRPEIQRAAA